MQNYFPRRKREALLIRPATPEDIAAMLRLQRSSPEAAHWQPREYDALFAPGSPPRIALIATEDPTPEVLGFLVARSLGEHHGAVEWEVENLAVDVMRRRKGLGAALVRELLFRATVAKVRWVILEVRESNLAALRLYEKAGFTCEGRRKNYYRNPAEDALLLRASIAVV